VEGLARIESEVRKFSIVILTSNFNIPHIGKAGNVVLGLSNGGQPGKGLLKLFGFIIDENKSHGEVPLRESLILGRDFTLKKSRINKLSWAALIFALHTT